MDGAATIERASGPTVPIMDRRLQTWLVQLVQQDLLGGGIPVLGINLGLAQHPSTSLEDLLAQYLTLDRHPAGPYGYGGPREAPQQDVERDN
jgi:hypothetical protein